MKRIVLVLLALGLAVATGIESLAHQWMAPQEAAKIENPVAQNKKVIELGKNLYMEFCTSCHAENLQGMSAQETGLGMNAPNLIMSLKSHSDGDVFWKIQQGRGEMPAFKDDLTEQEIWSVIHYIHAEAL